MSELVAFFDGSNEPVNPGGTMGMGVVVFRTEGFKVIGEGKSTKTSYSSCQRLLTYVDKIFPEDWPGSETTNNIAEYLAFGKALDWMFKSAGDIKNLHVFGDSQLVVKQMNNEWGINSGAYTKLAYECAERIKELKEDHGMNIFIRWIPRDMNNIADQLSK